MTQNTPTIWLNGSFETTDKPLILVDDSGFQRGLGVFDTMLGTDGAPVNPRPHLERLVHDCKTVLLYDPQLDINELTKTATALLQKNNLTTGHARIRTQITAGVTKEMLGKPETPLLMMSVTPAIIPQTPPAIRAVIIEDYPRIARCIFENSKKLDYTRSYYAKHKAIERGGDEAIVTNTDGNIACGVTSSLFILEGMQLITPPLTDGVLNGITRKGLIADKGAIEESISKERLLAADAVYLVNSILGVRPVIEINGKAFEEKRAAA